MDDCVGSLDACGICNGPGAIYECGCSDIPAGDCDCDGNQLDALGVCGGDCTSDANGNGVCDDAEVAGCTDSAACNYDAAATEDDGSCDFCSCARSADYTLTVTSAPAAGAPGMVYRFYVDMQDATDRMSAVFGNDQASLLVNTPDGAFNSPFNSSWNASGINPAFLPVFPELADDSYATIGLMGPRFNVRHCWCCRSFACGGRHATNHALLLDAWRHDFGKHNAHRSFMVRVEHSDQRSS